MADSVHDPVHRARYSFTPAGENLIVDCWIGAGGRLPEHLHPRQEERWSVIRGRIRFGLGDTKREIGPADGEMVVAPGTKHSLESVGDEEAHLRCQVRPALALQSFLEESAAAAREGLFMRGGVPRNLRGARWAARFLKRYRADVVMSFPPRPVQSAMIALLGSS
jgi:mannose-6-phosphate isomerase-like protein (cupin superfamily)